MLEFTAVFLPPHSVSFKCELRSLLFSTE